MSIHLIQNHFSNNNRNLILPGKKNKKYCTFGFCYFLIIFAVLQVRGNKQKKTPKNVYVYVKVNLELLIANNVISF